VSQLTRKAVEAALDRPPEVLPDGRVQCPLCPFIAQSSQTLGPHMITHRREVGLAPAKRPTGPRAKNGVKVRATTQLACTLCSSTSQSANMPRHLRQVHGLSAREAGDLTIQFRAAARAPSVELVPVDGDGEPEPESVLTDVSGVEFATGLLVTARRDGLMPVRLLPRVAEWIAHTDELLAELARLSR